MNRDQPGVFFSYFSRCCMLVVPSTKGQLLFVTTRRGTTGDMVQRYLFRYYSMHVAGNAGESAKSIGDAPFLRCRCSPLQATRFYLYRTFPRFAGWWALFLFSDTAVDRIPHFLILRFSPGGVSQLFPLPSDRSFSGCLLRGLTLSGTKTHVKQRFLPLTPLLMVSDVLWSPVLPA